MLKWTEEICSHGSLVPKGALTKAGSVAPLRSRFKNSRPPSRFAASRSRLEGFFLARSASFLRLPDHSQGSVRLPPFPRPTFSRLSWVLRSGARVPILYIPCASRTSVFASCPRCSTSDELSCEKLGSRWFLCSPASGL